MNLTWVNDWATTYAFVDAFKASRPWISHRPSDGTWDTEEPFDLDENGWVRSLGNDQHAGTLMVIEQGEHVPAGEYVVLYEGEGALTFDFDATVISEAPGRIVLDVQPSGDSIGGIHMAISETNPDNHIRNIRVVMPGFEQMYDEHPFHPDYVEWLKQFSVLRFMDWGLTTFIPPGEWLERAGPSDARQSTPRGVALEYMIALANEVGGQPWICVPHLATDEFVRNMATLFRDQLDPGLKVYVEYSNEVWNPDYPQHAYSIEQGESLGLAPGNPGLAGHRFFSQRSVEVFDLFEEVFGATDRFVRVMAGQSDTELEGATWLADQLLGWQNAHEKTDAYAVAPYFGYPLGTDAFASQLESLSLEALLDSAEADMRRMILASEGLHDHVAGFGVDLITYEAGMGFVPSGAQIENPAAAEKLNSLNRHERMYGIYAEHLSAWASFGDLMLLYTDIRRFDKWGAYGHLKRVGQPLSEAHKFRAVVDYLGSGPGGGNPTVGDFDSNGRVDFEDFLLFAGAFGGTDSFYDLNGDWRVNFEDVLIFAAAFGG